MRAVLYCLLFLLVSSTPTYASAQRWTVQVFAYSQAARAEDVAAQLRDVGYDAYTDATPGASLTQVRIGCFGARADAEGLAQDVRQRVAADALVVSLSAEATPTVCAERELGFVPPAAWGLESSTASRVTFWLEADGKRTITFDGQNWALGQTVSGASASEAGSEWFDTLLPVASSPGLGETLRATFRATQSRGVPLVRADLGGGSLLVTAGKLLWRSAGVAVVQQGADVFALSLTRP